MRLDDEQKTDLPSSNMRILNASKVTTPGVEELRLEAPVSTPGGNYCAPLYIGHSPSETLGIQLGPARIHGIVRTSRICYLDLELSDAQIQWARQLEEHVRSQLPGHRTVWFTRDMQAEDIDYFYDSSIQESTLRARVQRCESFDTLDLQVFEESGQLGDIDLVQGDATVLALVALRGVSHHSGRLSLDWVVEQVLVRREPRCKISLGEEAGTTTATEAPLPAPAATPAPEAPPVPPASTAPPPATTNTQHILPPPPPLASTTPAAPAAPAQEPYTDGEITEVDSVLPAGDSLILRSEAELVADELEQQVQEERERRHVALQMFMEANGLDPEAYYFPDTDEEDEEDDSPLAPDAEAASASLPAL